MTEAQARRYLVGLAAAHGAVVLFTLGLLLTSVGLARWGVSLILVGIVIGTIAIVTTWVLAVRARAGKAWFGPGSVMEDANERLGWGLVPESARALGWSPVVVRRAFVWSVVSAVTLGVLAVVVGAAG